MPRACPTCGQDIAEPAVWNALRVGRMGEVYWQGVKREPLSPVRHAILKALARTGTASFLALEMQVAGTSAKLIEVHICQLRKWLAAQGVPVRIASERGFGYRLEMSPHTA